ncbi:MAG: S8 family serine peptidase [Pirellulales bacterium]
MAVLPFPEPEALAPLGAQLWTSSAEETLAKVGDSDRFLIVLAAGQALEVSASSLDPTLDLKLVLRGPDDAVVAETNVKGVGQGEWLRGQVAPASGLYSVEVLSVAGAGRYAVNLLLGAEFELETLAGASNDVLAEAEPLPAFHAVNDGVSLAAVSGQRPAQIDELLNVDFSNGLGGFQLNNSYGIGGGQWHVSTLRSDTPGHSPNRSLYFGARDGSGYADDAEGVAASPSIDLRGVQGQIELSFNYLLDVEEFLDVASVEVVTSQGVDTIADNSLLGNLLNTAGEFRSLSLDLTAYVGQRVSVRFHFVSDFVVAYEGWFVDDVVVRQIRPPAADVYRVDLTAGALFSIALAAQNGPTGQDLELLDATGQKLAVGLPSQSAPQRTIHQFVPTTDGAYYVRVAGVPGDYGLVVTQGADFNAEIGGHSKSAQWLSPAARALGGVGHGAAPLATEAEPNDDGQFGPILDDLPLANDLAGSFVPTTGADYQAAITGALETRPGSFDIDLFRFLASPGDSVKIALESRGLGDPLVELYDKSGRLLASDDDGGSGLDSLLLYDRFPYAGEFFIAAKSYDLGAGGYALTTTLTTPAPIRQIDEDWYRVWVQVGDQVTLATSTPGAFSGTTWPRNTLDPTIELFTTTGERLAGDLDSAADGRNAFLTFTATKTGEYLVRVAAEEQTQGEYVLSISGATGEPEGVAVGLADPQLTDPLPYSLAAVELQFDSGLLLSSVAASDLQIDGQPAQSVEALAGDRVRFTFAPLAEGKHSLLLPAGAVLSLDERAGQEYAVDVVIDTTAPRVIGSSVQAGDVLPAGPVTLAFTFDEPLAASVTADDFSLIGRLHGAIQPTVFNYDPVSSKLQLVYASLPDDQFKLSLRSGDGAFEDLAGNDLDGEALAFPLPPGRSGNGQPGGDFNVAFFVDATTAEFPLPLAPLAPLGSLAYTGKVQGLWNAAGDADRFDLPLEGGQALSLAVQTDAPLEASLEVRDAAGAVIASLVAPAGAPLVLSGVRIETAGVYSIVATAASGAGIAYTIDLSLNAGLELEDLLQPPSSNDTPATAQDLESTAVALADGADRLAVRGSQTETAIERLSRDFETGLGGFTINNNVGIGGGQWTRTSFRANEPGHSGARSLHFGRGPTSTYNPLAEGEAISPRIDLAGATGRVELSFNYLLSVEAPYDEARVEITGNNGRTTLASSSNGTLAQSTDRWRNATFDLTQFAGQEIRVRFYFISDPLYEYEGWYVDDVVVREVQPASPDYYSFHLEAGQHASLSLESDGSSQPSLWLFDGQGAALAAGAAAANATSALSDFVAPAAGVYYARVVGGRDAYTLVAVRGGGFDRERNDSAATAQDVAAGAPVLGYIPRADEPDANSLVNPPTSPTDSAAADTNGWPQPVHGPRRPQPIDAAPNRLIVAFKPETTHAEREKLIAQAGHTMLQQLSLIDAVVLSAPGEGEQLLEQAAWWSKQPGVAYAEPDYVVRADATRPNDPFYGSLWGLENTGQTQGAPGADISAAAAWDIFRGSHQVVVAVIDSGVDYRHEDLAANIWTNPGEIAGDGIDNDGNGFIDDIHGIDTANDDSDPMDDAGHGTHVAGTIGAVGNNSVGVVGVNWNVQIMPLKFLSALGIGFTSDAIAAIDYMTLMKTKYGVNIVASNNSWGGGAESQALYDAIAASNAAGVLFVAAAGNSGSNADEFAEYPAAYDLPGIVSVAATDAHDELADFSNFGAASVDLAAPGVGILSTTPDNTYDTYSGTSMATPHVTGVVALVSGLAPNLSLAEIKDALLASADQRPSLVGKMVSGGRLNAARMVGLFGEPADWYRVSVSAGDELVMTTSTPGDAAGQFDNVLDPLLELYDAAGVQVAVDHNSAADGRNAQLTYRASEAGTLFVRVASERGAGEYLLRVDGATGPRTPFAAVAVDTPADARLNAAPPAVTISFSDLVSLPTLAAGDLTVDGLPAVSVEAVDGLTLRFTLPNLAEGPHVLRLAAGAIVDLQGTPLEAWESNFFVDLTAPRVVETSIAPGAVLPVGAVEFTARFNEPLAAGSLDPSDVLLVGETTGKQRVQSLSYDPATSTLKLLFPVLPDDRYVLKLLSGDRQFEDLVGWDLDGEAPAGPLPPGVSGNGQPGGDFELSFTVDVQTQLLTEPLHPVLPLGSLVYSGEVSALAAPAGDVDTYLVALAAGQTLSLVATPSDGLTPTLEIRSPEGNALGSAAAASPSSPAVIQTFLATTAGLYRVVVGGAAGSTGSYRLQLVVNAAVEVEPQNGPANDDLASAQSLAGSFVELGPGADRAAVLGDQAPPTTTIYRQDFESGLGGFALDNTFELGQGQWHRSTGRGHDAGHSASHSLYFGSGEGEEGGGLYNSLIGGAALSPEIDLRNVTGQLQLRFNYFLEADGFGDLARVEAVVNGSVVTLVADNLTLGNLSDFTEGFRTAVIDVSQFRGERVQFRFAFSSDFFAELEGWYLDDVEIRSIGDSSPDFYSVALSQGQPATIALRKNGGPEMDLEVLDAAGQTVATSGPRASNLDRVIQDFVAPVTGQYYVRIRGGSTPYTLLVTRGADFDHERNDELADAQDLDGSGMALGHVIGGAEHPATNAGGVSTSSLPATGPAAGMTRLIVRFDDPLLSLGQLKSLSTPVRKVGALPLVSASLFDVPTNDLAQVLDVWRQAPGVRYAEPDYSLQLLDTIPNDPRFNELYGLNNTGQTGGTPGADIDAPQAWDITTGSGDVVIASIDTGIDYRHEDLAANIWVNPGEIAGDGIDNDGNGYIDDIHGIDTANGDSDPFDDNGHGTHTAGTMAAEGNNGVGVTGIAWNAKLMALKFLSSAGTGSTSDAIAAIQYMTMMKTRYGVNIVVSNNSWGGGEGSEALREAIAASIDAGILFVAAAGNLGSNNDQFPTYPANFDLEGLVSVAATDHRDALASFSNYGATTVDLAAPGVDILSTTPNNTYSVFSGTSMATPHVSGVAALLADLNPGLTPREIEQILRDGADRLPQLAGQVISGGRLNAAGSLALAGQPNDWYHFSAAAGEEIVIRTSTPTWTALEADSDLDPRIELYDAAGLLIAQSDNSAADGLNVRLGFVAPAAGHYYVRVLAAHGRGEYVLTVDRTAAVPPQVLAVDLASSQWTAGFAEQLAGQQGFSLPAGTDFGSPLPWSNLDRISVRFNQPMMVGKQDLLLVRLDDPTHFLAIAGFSYDESTRTATWTTAAPLAAGRYLLGLSADVKDKHDRPLDGEWQASAEFPSGDGQAGGNFRLGFSVLPGDADRSGRIGLDDFGLLRGAFGEPSTFVDFGGNGSVDLDDFAVLKQNFGQRLPRTAFEGLGEQEALQALDDLVHEQAAGLPEENESELQALLSDLALSHWFED